MDLLTGLGEQRTWREENSITVACGSVPTVGFAAWPALSGAGCRGLAAG